VSELACWGGVTLSCGGCDRFCLHDCGLSASVYFPSLAMTGMTTGRDGKVFVHIVDASAIFMGVFRNHDRNPGLFRDSLQSGGGWETYERG
jgi:hypothetical protein